MEGAFKYLETNQLIQLQVLSRKHYLLIADIMDSCEVYYQSWELDSKTLFQYFNGSLMALDFQAYHNMQNPVQQILSDYKKCQLIWQPLLPNQRTSSAITSSLYFGRAIYIPMPKTNSTLDVPSRVFVMSGCTDKNNTNLNCSEVQEWRLDDMTVTLLQPLVPSRTSYGCCHMKGDRYIYVLGGNEKSNLPLFDVQRLDIFKKKWEQLPDMIQPRANPSTIRVRNSDYLYALGGYNNIVGSQGSCVVNSIERLNIAKPVQWEAVIVAFHTPAQACNYMHQLPDESILVFGGWQSGMTSKTIDVLSLDKLTYKKWSIPLSQSDMITKPIILIGDSLLVIQGRKQVHLVDTANQTSTYLQQPSSQSSGEDMAEIEALSYKKLRVQLED